MNNKLLINIICTLFFLCVTIKLHSQIFLSEPSQYIQQSRVGLVDEFLKRFNGDILHPDISIQDSAFRCSNMLYLVEPSHNIAHKDSFYNEVVKFTNIVIKDSVKLNFYDSVWFARTKCKGTLDKKPVSFTIYLNVECRKDDMYKWVISRVEGECFNITANDTISNIMLYPDDHETKFISLGRMTNEQPYNVAKFMSKRFEYDATSVFAYLVKSNKLKIDYVDELEFIFTQVPGYIFSIKYFERESSKSGWLINDLSIVSEIEKRNFLQLFNFNYSKKNTTEKDEIDEASLYNDSILYDVKNPEKVFYLRLIERKYLLNQYLSILDSIDGNKLATKYYQDKLLALFSPNSYVFINNGESYGQRMLVYDFLKKISTHKYDYIGVEKITVPMWSDSLLAKSIVSSNAILLPAKIEMFNSDECLNVEKTNQLVIVKQEQTEKGLEWIPYFGNIFVTIK